MPIDFAKIAVTVAMRRINLDIPIGHGGIGNKRFLKSKRFDGKLRQYKIKATDIIFK